MHKGKKRMPRDNAFLRISEHHVDGQEKSSKGDDVITNPEVIENISLRLIEKTQVTSYTKNKTKQTCHADRREGNALPSPERGLIQTAEDDEGVMLANECKRQSSDTTENSFSEKNVIIEFDRRNLLMFGFDGGMENNKEDK